MSIINNYLKEHISIVELLQKENQTIEHIAEKCNSALRNGKKIIIMGNGGSAADSQHFAAELVGRYKLKRRGLPALALASNLSELTALGNDFKFEYIFKKGIEAFAVEGDVVIGISTSGNSKNIINGITTAKKIGCHTIAFLGCDGGKIKDISDSKIIVPSNNTPIIQECHEVLYHIICEIIDMEFSNG